MNTLFLWMKLIRIQWLKIKNLFESINYQPTILKNLSKCL